MVRNDKRSSKPESHSLLSFDFSPSRDTSASLSSRISRLFTLKKYGPWGDYYHVIDFYDLQDFFRSHFNDQNYTLKYIYDDLIVVPGDILVLAVKNPQGDVILKLPSGKGINFDIYLTKKDFNIWKQILDNITNGDWLWGYNRFLGDCIVAFENSYKPIRVVVTPGRSFTTSEKRVFFLVDLKLGNIIGPSGSGHGFTTREEAQAATDGSYLREHGYEILEVKNFAEAVRRVTFKREYPPI